MLSGQALSTATTAGARPYNNGESCSAEISRKENIKVMDFAGCDY